MEKYIGIVAHDAGGANILSSYCRRKPDNYRYLLQGPAKAIFEKTLSIESEDNFGRFVSECHSFICGTSGKSDLERSIFAQARFLNKETTAILDHWINYRERFLLNGKLVLPNNLITVDSYAYQIAKETFPECKIEEIDNPYLEELYNHYKELTLQKESSYKSEILYISEGFSDHKEEGKNGSSKDLKYFKEFLHAKQRLFEPSLALRIRLHPSEDLAKFNPNIEETYEGFFSKCMELNTIIQQHGGVINRYFELIEKIQDWDSMYSPNISISEVNNPSMGHVYMGKMRIPVYFAKSLGGNRKVKDVNVITFVVCKYKDYPGPEYKNERRKLGVQKALEQLKKVYPDRFPDSLPGRISVGGVTVEDPVETLANLVEKIKVFQENLGNL